MAGTDKNFADEICALIHEGVAENDQDMRECWRILGLFAKGVRDFLLTHQPDVEVHWKFQFDYGWVLCARASFVISSPLYVECYGRFPVVLCMGMNGERFGVFKNAHELEEGLKSVINAPYFKAVIFTLTLPPPKEQP